MYSTDWDEQGGNNHQGIVEFPVGSDEYYARTYAPGQHRSACSS